MECDFCAEWLNGLMMGIEKNCQKQDTMFEYCANVHYKMLQLDNLLEAYIGHLHGFCVFLEKEWGWKISFSSDGKTITVDENKNFCVCPITEKVKGKVSPLLCNCSNYFAKKMFSKICQKDVTANVKRSFLRDGKSCIYEIHIP